MSQKLTFTCISLILALSIVVLIPAQASGSTEKSPIEDEPEWVVPSHIQLSPMMVPIISKKTSTAVVSMFIQVTSKEHVGDVCRRLPRIRDAILRTLSRSPIPVHRNKLVLKDVSGRLTMPIDRALGGGMVHSVYVVPGALQMNTGSVSRLPFASNGCKTIRKKQAEAIKAKQKAQEGK